MNQQYMTSRNLKQSFFLYIYSLYCFIVSGGCAEQSEACCKRTTEDLDPFDLGSTLGCIKVHMDLEAEPC